MPDTVLLNPFSRNPEDADERMRPGKKGALRRPSRGTRDSRPLRQSRILRGTNIAGGRSQNIASHDMRDILAYPGFGSGRRPCRSFWKNATRFRKRRKCGGTRFLWCSAHGDHASVLHRGLVGAGFKPARTQDACWHHAEWARRLRQSRVCAGLILLAVNRSMARAACGRRYSPPAATHAET